MQGNERKRTSRRRLGHTKSRTGCSRCRSRRVKCDQTRPVCNNCHRHNAECFYDRAPEYMPSALDAPIYPQNTSSTIAPTVSDLPINRSPGSRRMELRLFHNFAVHISGTLAGTHIPSLRDCWSVQVPSLALDFEPLFNILLAVSAQHLLSTTDSPLPDPELQQYYVAYLDTALRQHRESLQQIQADVSLDPKSSNALCFTSILLMVQAFASLRDRSLDPYEPPLQWLRIARGIRLVFRAANIHGDSQVDAGLMSTILRVSSDLHDPSNFSSETYMAKFRYLMTAFPEEADEMKSVYEPVVTYIGSMQAAVESGKHHMAFARSITAFAILIPPEFIDLLQERRQRPMVIMAHFFALCLRCQDLWWHRGTAKREIQAIQAVIRPEWQGYMEWPVKMLETTRHGDLESDALTNHI